MVITSGTVIVLCLLNFFDAILLRIFMVLENIVNDLIKCVSSCINIVTGLVCSSLLLCAKVIITSYLFYLYYFVLFKLIYIVNAYVYVCLF